MGSGGFDAKICFCRSFYGLIWFHLASQKRFKSRVIVFLILKARSYFSHEMKCTEMTDQNSEW